MGSIDWPGLLQWSLKYADGTTESKVTKMTQEDRDFLEGAVREAMGSQVDHWSVAGDSIAKFRNLNDDVVITSLSVLERCVDDCPPIAGDIEKLGGIEPFVKIIQSREEPTILKAMQVAASSRQSKCCGSVEKTHSKSHFKSCAVGCRNMHWSYSTTRGIVRKVLPATRRLRDFGAVC
eukprot:Platyproteum_vivax@DN4865_c0_g1_i1.p1